MGFTFFPIMAWAEHLPSSSQQQQIPTPSWPKEEQVAGLVQACKPQAFCKAAMSTGEQDSATVVAPQVTRPLCHVPLMQLHKCKKRVLSMIEFTLQTNCFQLCSWRLFFLLTAMPTLGLTCQHGSTYLAKSTNLLQCRLNLIRDQHISQSLAWQPSGWEVELCQGQFMEAFKGIGLGVWDFFLTPAI